MSQDRQRRLIIRKGQRLMHSDTGALYGTFTEDVYSTDLMRSQSIILADGSHPAAQLLPGTVFRGGLNSPFEVCLEGEWRKLDDLPMKESK